MGWVDILQLQAGWSLFTKVSIIARQTHLNQFGSAGCPLSASPHSQNVQLRDLLGICTVPPDPMPAQDDRREGLTSEVGKIRMPLWCALRG
jgi:hypothetical protein